MKCEQCDNVATGTFWIMYHKSHEIIEAHIFCDKCQEWDSMFWLGNARPHGFIPGFFNNDIEAVFEKLDTSGYFARLLK